MCLKINQTFGKMSFYGMYTDILIRIWFGSW